MLGAANPNESDFALVVRLDRGNHGFITRSSRCGTRSGARRPGMAAIRNDYRHPAARGSLPKLSAAAGANLRALPDAENPSPNGDGFRAVDEAEMRNRYRWIFSDRILIMTRGNGHRTALCLDALSPRVYSGETDKPASSIIALVGRCFARRTRPWTGTMSMHRRARLGRGCGGQKGLVWALVAVRPSRPEPGLGCDFDGH